MVEPAQNERKVRFLTFSVGPELFVFDIMRVQQIVPYRGTSAVPGSPDFIEGVMVLRGEVVPVIDLHNRFFPDQTLERPEASLVLVTRTPAGILGLRVDEVRKILTVELSEIMPAPPIIHGLKGEMFIGVIEQNQELFLVIDVDHLLTPEQLRAHEATTYEIEVEEASEVSQ